MKTSPLLLLALSLVVLLLTSTSLAENLSDIENLAKKKLWHEVLEKAEKVPSSQRDDSWNNLVSKSFQHTLNSTTLNIGLADITYFLERYPFLQNNAELGQQIGTRLAKDLDDCASRYYSKIDDCSKQATFILNSTNSITNSQALDVADTFARRNKPYSLALYATLFRKSDLNPTEISKLCSESSLPQAVAEGFRSRKDEHLSKLALEATTGVCRSEVLAALKDSLSINSPGSDYYNNVCPILIEAGLLKGFKKKRCSSES